MGVAESRYQTGLGFLNHPDPGAIPAGMEDLLIHSAPAVASLGGQSVILIAIAALLTLFVALGIIATLLSDRWRASDWYVVATLALFAVVEWKLTRYLLPVAPFLLCYLLRGVTTAARVLKMRRDGWSAWPAKALLVLWVCWVAAFDGFLLVKGNLKSHRGLSLLASPSAEEFYLGQWRELYQASQHLKSEGLSGPVGLLGSGNRKYVIAFSGRRCIDYPTSEPIAFLMVVDAAPMPEGDPLASRLVEIGRWGSVVLYRVGPTG
jgi:hypothetical protein